MVSCRLGPAICHNQIIKAAITVDIHMVYLGLSNLIIGNDAFLGTKLDLQVHCYVQTVMSSASTVRNHTKTIKVKSI